METALATINVFPSSRDELQRYHRTIKAEILAHKAPLTILAQLKYLEKVIENILKDKDIKDHFLAELFRYDKNDIVKFNGVEMYEMETNVKYHFDDCGDVVYNDLIREQEELKAKIKERENYLKSLPTEGTVCPKYGNFLTRPGKSSTTTVACKIL